MRRQSKNQKGYRKISQKSDQGRQYQGQQPFQHQQRPRQRLLLKDQQGFGEAYKRSIKMRVSTKVSKGNGSVLLIYTARSTWSGTSRGVRRQTTSAASRNTGKLVSSAASWSVGRGLVVGRIGRARGEVWKYGVAGAAASPARVWARASCRERTAVRTGDPAEAVAAGRVGAGSKPGAL